jgi:hypothetical protein
MRFRIGVILVALMALTGLSAPVAFASSHLPSAGPDLPLTPGCTVGTTYGPWDLVPNVNPAVGVTYPGVGKQATVTSNSGSTYFKCLGGGGTYDIYNSNGNCLRMRDGNNGYAVMEESGCNESDEAELFNAYQGSGTGLVIFQNIATLRYLGVACPGEDGWKIWGETGATGTCVNWGLGPA